MSKGIFGIGAIGMKTSENYGTLFRSAQIMGANFVFLIGCRFKKQPTDTCRSYNNIPTYTFETFEDFYKNGIPYGTQLVGIELTPMSTKIEDFDHPKKAIYLLGAEDNGISKAVLSKCHHVIQLPGDYSLNVSVAGSIVMYDRIQKQKK